MAARRRPRTRRSSTEAPQDQADLARLIRYLEARAAEDPPRGPTATALLAKLRSQLARLGAAAERE